MARGCGEHCADTHPCLLPFGAGDAYKMSLRSPLGRILGRGSAKEGVHHWWLQRLTSVALVPLSIGFLASLLALPALDYASLVAWLRQSGMALGLILFVLVAARHSQLG